MANDILASLRRLSDAELVAPIRSLTARERDATAQLVAHLAELDTRDVHLRAGYGSLFVYCRDALGLSENEAYNRIEVARAARRFPVILEWLTKGDVGLTTVRLLAPHLTADNHRAVLEPDRYKLQLTIAGDTLEKLKLAKDLLRHAIPSGDDAAVLDRALTALLTALAKKKFAAADRPRASPGVAPGSRWVPAEVKRQVWLRDLGRCAFVGTDGHRCAERGFLEFHHVRPYAVGGEPTVGNIELRCRRHNGYEARLYFGQDRAHGYVREEAAPSASWSIRAADCNSFRNEFDVRVGDAPRRNRPDH